MNNKNKRQGHYTSANLTPIILDTPGEQDNINDDDLEIQRVLSQAHQNFEKIKLSPRDTKMQAALFNEENSTQNQSQSQNQNQNLSPKKESSLSASSDPLNKSILNDPWLSSLRNYIEESLEQGKQPSKVQIIKIISRSLTKEEYDSFPKVVKERFSNDLFYSLSTENQKPNIEKIRSNFDISEFEEAIKDQEEDEVPRGSTYSRTGSRINVAVDELTRVNHQGYLIKQGNSVKNWKRRWCVLQDFCLYYFKTPKDLTALGMITLPSYTITPIPSGTKKFMFHATHNNMRTYVFCAESEEEMKGWINAMQLASVCRYA